MDCKIFSHGRNNFDLQRNLCYLKERNRGLFARCSQALVMSEIDCLTLERIVLFEVIVGIASGLVSCVVNMESHYYDLKPILQRAK